MENTDRFDLSAVIETQKRVVTTPVAFYQSMPVTGGFTNPVIFVVVMSFFGALVLFLWSLMGAGPATGMATGLLSVIGIPVFVVIGSFVGALFLLVIWKLMGSVLDYEGAYRCLAFSMAIFPIVAIANLIPYLGQALNVVWGLWLMVIASEHTHKINPRRATIVFGILGIIFLFSSLTAEYQARKMQDIAEEWQEEVGEMSSEDAGKAAAAFIGGLAQGRGVEMTEQDKAELTQATEALAKIAQQMKAAGEKMQKDGSAEEAAAAFGAMLGSMGKAGAEMARQSGSERTVLALATDPDSLQVDELESLGTIEKPASGLQLEVNDGDAFAPLTRSVSVYRDGEVIRYQLWVEKGYLSSFTALRAANNPASSIGSSAVAESAGDAARAMAQGDNTKEEMDIPRRVALRNAIIYSYDKTGNPVSGDECVESILQFPSNSAQSGKTGERMFWLVCVLSERQTISG